MLRRKGNLCVVGNLLYILIVKGMELRQNFRRSQVINERWNLGNKPQGGQTERLIFTQPAQERTY